MHKTHFMCQAYLLFSLEIVAFKDGYRNSSHKYFSYKNCDKLLKLFLIQIHIFIFFILINNFSFGKIILTEHIF